MTGDVIAEFIGAMEASGVKPAEPIADRLGGPLVRFHCEGDGRGKRNGWARLHLDGIPAGAFGNYRMGIAERWRSGTVERLTPAERRERARQMRERQAEREAEQRKLWEETAAQASILWDSAPPAWDSHPYLRRKAVSGEGLRQDGNALLVPMRDVTGRLWNIQRIYPDGFKRFLKGGRVDGLFWPCGEPDAVLCIGEGVGTMAAVRRATGHAVAAAITGANLKPVALDLKALWPDCDLIICADDDRALVDHPHIKRNLGLDYARSAAAAVGGRLAIPGDHE